MIRLSRALRLSPKERVAVVGAGGKTTLVFQIAHSYSSPVITAATTHLSKDQLGFADHAYRMDDSAQIESILNLVKSGVTLFTGAPDGEGKEKGLTFSQAERVCQAADRLGVPLVIEADGSKQLPLKAPASHEPPIPPWLTLVVVVAGMSGLGRRLVEGQIHRPEIFSQLSGIPLGEPVTMEGLVRVLNHPEGGLKNIPPTARRVVLLNQADTPEDQLLARQAAADLLKNYDSVVCGSLNPAHQAGRPETLNPQIHFVAEACAAILLAAGDSRRMGQPKQLLEYHGEPFVRVIARKALLAGYSPVILVTGADAEDIANAVSDLPLIVARNPDWQSGQSTSVQVGLSRVPPRCGAALFLLTDQPQIPVTLLKTLQEAHGRTMPDILAPGFQGRRGNPVLFDRNTFPAFDRLIGDEGARRLMLKYPVELLEWPDERILLDVDSPQDYQTLLDRDDDF